MTSLFGDTLLPYHAFGINGRLACGNVLPLIAVLPAGCAGHDVAVLRLKQSGKKRGVGQENLELLVGCVYGKIG